MAKFAAVVFLLVFVGLPVVYLAAESPDDPAVKRDKPAAKDTDPAVANDAVANDAGANDAPVAKRNDAAALVEEDPLGKTVRLTFTVKNDDGEHTHTVLCAARSFLIEHDVADDNGGHQLKFQGLLKAVDQNDRVFVQYNLMHNHSNTNDGLDATFKLKGSAMPTLDKKLALGSLGEQQISLTVTLVD